MTRHLPDDQVEIRAGWFRDTVAAIPAATTFAMVHVDGDLYESAIDVLDGLLERRLLSEGALICFDDWDCNRADPAFGERRAWAEVVSRYGIVASDQGGYGPNSRAFIVHAYT